jgi:adenosylcobinamide-GDP ribazoletransferase
MSLLLALYPLVGLALGALAAAAAMATASVAPALAGPAGVLALEALSRLGPRRALAGVTRLGAPLAAALFAVKLAAAAGVPRPALASALMLAAMLGRWAIVVLCYGGASLDREPGDELPGRAAFGEFGWASLTAFAVTLSVAEAIGLVLLLVAALVTLAVRIVSHRRVGGVNGRIVRAAGEVVETAVLAALAILAAVLGR